MPWALHRERSGGLEPCEQVRLALDPVDPLAHAQFPRAVREQDQLAERTGVPIRNIGLVPRKVEQREHVLRQLRRRVIIGEVKLGRHGN